MKETEARWEYVSRFSSDAILFRAGVMSKVLASLSLPPRTRSVVSRRSPGPIPTSAPSVYRSPGVRPRTRCAMPEASSPRRTTLSPLPARTISAPPLAFQASRSPPLKPGSDSPVNSP